jgi:hypothetical protein
MYNHSLSCIFLQKLAFKPLKLSPRSNWSKRVRDMKIWLLLPLLTFPSKFWEDSLLHGGLKMTNLFVHGFGLCGRIFFCAHYHSGCVLVPNNPHFHGFHYFLGHPDSTSLIYSCKSHILPLFRHNLIVANLNLDRTKGGTVLRTWT